MDHNYHRTKKVNRKMYRHCKVPSCQNSTFITPDKLFLKVPSTAPVRQKWLETAGVIADASTFIKTPDLYFCEDHFQLDQDIENYMAYKMGYLKRIRLRKGCLPSKFSCQHDRSVVNSFIKMDVLQGKNILAIETMANESKDARSGLIINVGAQVLYESSYLKEDISDDTNVLFESVDVKEEPCGEKIELFEETYIKEQKSDDVLGLYEGTYTKQEKSKDSLGLYKSNYKEEEKSDELPKLFKSNFPKEEPSDKSLELYEPSLKRSKGVNVQSFHEEFYKFIQPKLQVNRLPDNLSAYKHITIVNEIAISKDHDYCKKKV